MAALRADDGELKIKRKRAGQVRPALRSSNYGYEAWESPTQRRPQPLIYGVDVTVIARHSFTVIELAVSVTVSAASSAV